MFWEILSALILILITLLLISKFYRKKINIQNKHVMVTGGSKGIGKSIVIQCLKLGANVTVIARDDDVLEALKMDLLKNHVTRDDQKVMTISLDVTSDIYNIEKAVEDSETELGPIFMLVNCAGTSMSAKFEDTKISDFQRMMDLNYMASVKTTMAVLPSLKQQNGGCILFISSISGLLGLFGYSAYSASKFALLGLAETLAMELKSHNINVCISFPPDTDTPGFEEENKSKPVETRMISESGGLFHPDAVASAALNDALSGQFTSTVGTESLMVKTVCCGMMPVASIYEAAFQIVTMPIFRIISLVFLNSCHKIIDKCKNEKQKTENSGSSDE